MKYNDHIVFIEKGEKQFGRYIAYRPDKKTIVFEKAGLHELPEDEIRKATHEEICNFYGQLIETWKKQIQGDQNYILEMEKQIHNQAGTLKNRQQATDQLREDEEKILTCLTVAGVDISRESDDGFTQLKRDLKNVRGQLKNKFSECKAIERKIEMKNVEIQRRYSFIENAKNRIKGIEEIRDEYLKEYREAKEHGLSI